MTWWQYALIGWAVATVVSGWLVCRIVDRDIEQAQRWENRL